MIGLPGFKLWPFAAVFESRDDSECFDEGKGRGFLSLGVHDDVTFSWSAGSPGRGEHLRESFPAENDR